MLSNMLVSCRRVRPGLIDLDLSARPKKMQLQAASQGHEAVQGCSDQALYVVLSSFMCAVWRRSPGSASERKGHDIARQGDSVGLPGGS